MAAILVGVLEFRTQFWKRTTQESLQQSLVEICSGIRPYGKFTYQSSPLKPLGQLQPNFGGMVLGWTPLKIVSGDPDFQPRWPRRFKCNLLSKYAWFELHNRYKSAERKISQKNLEHMLNYSLPCSCWAGPFQSCVRQPRPSIQDGCCY
jgi:hypothetical protein